MEAETFPDADVKAKLAQFVLLQVDGDKDKATTEKYGVQGYPDFHVLKADGTCVYDFSGYSPPAEFAQELENGLSKAK